MWWGQKQKTQTQSKGASEREKIRPAADKWDLLKLKKTKHPGEEEAMEWERVFANCTSDRGLIPEYIKDSKTKTQKQQQNKIKQMTLLKNGPETWEFFKEENIG